MQHHLRATTVVVGILEGSYRNPGTLALVAPEHQRMHQVKSLDPSY